MIIKLKCFLNSEQWIKIMKMCKKMGKCASAIN